MSIPQETLNEDERILWSEKPNWSSAKPALLYWKFRIISFFVTAALFIGAYLSQKGGLEILCGIFIFFGGIGLFTVFGVTSEDNRKHDDEYIITDQRLIISRKNHTERNSYAFKSMASIQSCKNGAATDLIIFSGQKDYDYVTLYALLNPLPAETLIAKNLLKG